MATSRRSIIAVFVIVLTVGAALLFMAADGREQAHTSDTSTVSERSLASPLIASQVRSLEGHPDGDHGRRLPSSFGYFGVLGLAVTLAAVCAHRQPRRRIPILALARRAAAPRGPPHLERFSR